MQFLYSKHIPLIEEMIAKAQEKVIDTNPKDTFNMGFHAIPSMAQVKNKSTIYISSWLTSTTCFYEKFILNFHDIFNQ